RDRIREYGRMMIDDTNLTVSNWQPGDRRDLVSEMTALTLRIATRTLFDSDDVKDSAVVRTGLTESVRLFNERFKSLFRAPSSWPTPRNLRQRRITRALNSVIFRHIERRRREPLEGRHDLLSLLIQPRDADPDAA